MLLMALAWGGSKSQAQRAKVALTRQRLHETAAALAKRNGRPDSLDVLVAEQLLRAESLIDGWDNPLQYDNESGELCSFGADTLEGGSGFAGDLRPDTDGVMPAGPS